MNQDYFKEINTETRAYFLGLIYADGNVYKKSFQIVLAEEDASVLYLLRDELGLTKNICKINRSLKNPIWKDCIKFSIHNETIVEDLNSLGVVERKTYENLRLPIKGIELVRAFIRGFLDGDGFISCYGVTFIRKGESKTNYNLRKVIGFTNSSLTLLEDIRNFLHINLEISLGKIIRTDGTNSNVPSYSLHYTRVRDVNTIAEFLYKDSKIHFNRKFEKSELLKLSPKEFKNINT